MIQFKKLGPSYLRPALIRIGLVLTLAAVVVWILATSFFGGQSGFAGTKAPEFQGIHEWLNSPPLTLKGLEGKVVLVDFWTYTCVNCIRTFPYIKDWHARYSGDGLVIVGMHSPEFEFEKITENVAASAQEAGLEHPIAQDNDFATWNAYGNRFWPAKYLIDKDGVIRYTHFGEGTYRDTEKKIRELLEEAGASLEDVPLGAPLVAAGVNALASRGAPFDLTREIYGGFHRNNSKKAGYVAHSEYYDERETVVDYRDPGGHQNHQIYLQGPWFSGLEALEHARQSPSFEDYIGIKFSAATVNAVVNPKGDQPFQVKVTLDGRPLTQQEAGVDIRIDDGQSFITVNEGRLYNLVSLERFSEHELRLLPASSDFALFAFTFGS
jgi:thiol-disulfide isomerase/thioredoxin